MPRWTPEARAVQAARMREQQSWIKSTGPKTEDGKTRAAQNSFKHGLDSKTGLELRALLRLHGQMLKNIE